MSLQGASARVTLDGADLGTFSGERDIGFSFGLCLAVVELVCILAAKGYFLAFTPFGRALLACIRRHGLSGAESGGPHAN